MSREPDFDIDFPIGKRAELWVEDFITEPKDTGRVEVKFDGPALNYKRFYVEYKCLWRDGLWHDSGIMTTKADLYVFKFGELPGGLIVETKWLKRAFVHAAKNYSSRKQCPRGECPTKGVVVTLQDLYDTQG
jgi:hypothetical protein